MSGILTCSRCKATTLADSIETGRRKLDHSIGIYKGTPCEDGKAELFFTSDEKKAKAIVTPKTKKKTEQTSISSNNKTIDKQTASSKKG